jgi:hypothetical protein
VVDGGRSLWVIDLTVPDRPRVIGEIGTFAPARDITLAGDYVYIAQDSNDLQVVDISTPTAPEIVGAVQTPGFAFAAEVSGGYVYIADLTGGLQIAPAHCQPTPHSHREDLVSVRETGLLLPRAVPNPGRGQITVELDLSHGRFVVAEITDLSGRRVRELARGELAPGRHLWLWDGLDDGGRPVASGVYFAVIRSDGVLGSKRVLFLR